MKLIVLTPLAVALAAVACSAGSDSSLASSATASSEHEIVGGTIAADGTWAGTVAVYIGGSQSCGGTLIAPQWVLTAGHCVTRPTAENGGFDKIVAKRHKLSASGGESITVKKAWRHPQYNSSTMDNDIALIQLSSASTETPAKLLPASTAASTLVADTLLTVVGWGTLSSGAWSGSDDLRQVDVPVIENAKCKTFSGYTDLVESQFCAGYSTAGKDSCQGDSGGPIFVRVGDEQLQAGLVSWGIGCARANQPGVYTRVSNYFDWIKTTSSGAVDLDAPSTPADAGTDAASNEPTTEEPASDDGAN